MREVLKELERLKINPMKKVVENGIFYIFRYLKTKNI